MDNHSAAHPYLTEADAMTIIKSPSPSISKLNQLLLEKNINVSRSDIAEEYMALVSETLKYVGGHNLRYKNTSVDDHNGIVAEINNASLPHYEDIATAYLDVNFDKAMITRIQHIHNKIGDACPIADATSLRQPIGQWHPRWVTVYVWCLMCLAAIDNTKWSDDAVSDAVLDELITNLTP